MTARVMIIAAEVLIRLGSGRFQVTARPLPSDAKVVDIGIVKAEGAQAVGVGLTIESGEFAVNEADAPLPPPVVERIEPTREEYRELTDAVAKVLHHWRFAGFPGATDYDGAPETVARYFQSDAMAFHVLSAVVSFAWQARERLGWTQQQRDESDTRHKEMMRRVLAETVYPAPWPFEQLPAMRASQPAFGQSRVKARAGRCREH